MIEKWVRRMGVISAIVFLVGLALIPVQTAVSNAILTIMLILYTIYVAVSVVYTIIRMIQGK